MASLKDRFDGMVAKDPQKVLLRRALRMAVLVPFVFWAMSNVFNMPKATIPAVFGLFCVVAFADFGGPLLHRLVAGLVLTAVSAGLTYLGVLCGAPIWLAVVSTFVICFFIAYSSILRGYFASSTIPLLVPWVMAVTGQAPEAAAGTQALGWAIGGVIGSVALVVLWPAHILSPLRSQVAATLDSASKSVHALYLGEEPEADPSEDMEANRQKLAQFFYGRPNRPGPGTSRDRNLVQAIDQTSRLVTVLEWDASHEHSTVATGTKELAEQTCHTLRESAAAMRREGEAPDPAPLNAARKAQAQETLGWVEDQVKANNSGAIREALRSAFGVRMAAMSAQISSNYVRGTVGGARRSQGADVTIVGETVVAAAGNSGVFKYLLTHLSLSSPWTRNALRTAVALAVSVLVVALTGVEHGFWVSLGVVVALRFDTTGTFRTGKQMIIGTVVGYAIGILILLAAGTHQWVYWVLLPFVVFIAIYTPGVTSMTIGQGAFTVLLVVMFGVMLPGSIEASEYRIPDVLLGILVALVTAALMWPRGIAPLVAGTLRESSIAAAEHLRGVVQKTTGTIDTTEPPNKSDVLKAVSIADESFELSMAQMVPGCGDLRTWAAISNTNQHLLQVADVIEKLPTIGALPEAEETLRAVHSLVDDLPADMTQAITTLTEKSDQGAAAELLVTSDIDNSDDPKVQELEAALTKELGALTTECDVPGAVSLSVLSDWVIQSHWSVQRLQEVADGSIKADEEVTA